LRDIYSAAPIRAHAYLIPFDTVEPGAWLLTGVDVAYAERGKGVARELLRRVLADADAENVTLYLSIEPDQSLGSLNENQLRGWYKRLGFIIDPALKSPTAMIRRPKVAVA
jgi:GNAT superfamily N-acetyltransferase